VTDRAIVGEDFRAAREVGAGRRRQARQRAHEVGDGRNFIGLEQAVAAECRHRALMAGIVARARTVRDGLVDLRQRAAPEPVIVVQIGIAFGAAAAGPVAGSAIIGESPLAERAREVEQLGFVDSISLSEAAESLAIIGARSCCNSAT
jgi:hypothetical protein